MSAIELIVISHVDGSAADLTILTRRVTLGMITLTTVGLASFTKHVLAILAGIVSAGEHIVITDKEVVAADVTEYLLCTAAGRMVTRAEIFAAFVTFDMGAGHRCTVSAAVQSVIAALTFVMSAGKLDMIAILTRKVPTLEQ